MEIKKFDKSKDETFQIICNIRLFYNTYLTDNYKEEFLDKLNENPILHVILDDEFSYDSIKNFYNWKEYFMYQSTNKSKKLTLVKKKDVLRTLKNIRASIINDTLINQKHKLN